MYGGKLADPRTNFDDFGIYGDSLQNDVWRRHVGHRLPHAETDMGSTAFVYFLLYAVFASYISVNFLCVITSCLTLR